MTHRLARLPAALLTLCGSLACLSPALAQDNPDLVPALVKALRDDSALVRKRAALALERLGPQAKAARTALEDRLKDDDPDVRAAATAALAKIDGGLSLEELLRRLNGKELTAKVRVEACRELAERYWQEAAAARTLEGVLSDPDVKLEAAKALEAIDARLSGKPAKKEGGPRGTRVAVFNLKYVVTNYYKWATLQKDYEKELKEFEDRIFPLKGQFDALATQVKQGTLDPASQREVEAQMQKLQRQMQSIDEEAKATLTKKQSIMMVALYKDVADAVQSYAAAHDIDLVMHYNDGVNEAETSASENVFRKVNSGPAVPVFFRPEGVEISKELLAILNKDKKSPDK